MNAPIRRSRRVVFPFAFSVPLLAATIAPPLTPSAHGVEYSYKAIVENVGATSFDTLGAGFRRINDDGEAAYRANVSFSNYVFKSDGDVTTTIAGPPTFFGLNGGFGNGAIADDGSVVFAGSVTGHEGGNFNGIFVGSGGSAAAVQLSEGDPNTDLPERLFHNVSISPSGTIAYHGSRFDFPDQAPGEITRGYYLVTGSGLTTLAEDRGAFTSSGNSPVVNDAGQVAFIMGVGGSNSILRYSSGSLTTIKSNFNGGDEIWMNGSGDVIYADATHVYLYSGGVTTTVASEADGFHALMKPGNADVFINDAGDMAFYGSVVEFNGNPVPWDGIYTGPDVVNDRVLVRGDPLLGHTVSSLELLGLNNAGQLLLSVEANADGWRALVIATPTFDEADFDENGYVDGEDLADWQEGYGLPGTAEHADGDADGDGDVDGGDFLVWQRQVTPPLELASVPEPAGVLIGMGLLAALVLRRRAWGRLGACHALDGTPSWACFSK